MVQQGQHSKKFYTSSSSSKKVAAEKMKENQVNRGGGGGGVTTATTKSNDGNNRYPSKTASSSSLRAGTGSGRGGGSRRGVSFSDDNNNMILEEKKTDDGDVTATNNNIQQKKQQQQQQTPPNGNGGNGKPLSSSKRWGSGGSANNKKEQNSPQRSGGLISGIGKRLSSRFISSSNGSNGSNDKKKKKKKGGGTGGGSGFGLNSNSPSSDDDEDAAGEDDPVMTIFASRNTQRVRFTLEGVPPDNNSNNNNKNNKSNNQSSPRSSRKDDAFPRSSSTNSEGGERNSGGSGSGGSGIKSFMSRALFGTSKSSKNLDEEMKREVAELDGSLVWESAETPTGPEVIKTAPSPTVSDSKRKNKKGGGSPTSGEGGDLTLSFEEDPKAREAVVKLLNKARRAEHIRFKYEYAVKCYLKALSILKKAKYPDDHPTVLKTVGLLNNAHHTLSSYKNSANIVKMGIKNEDSGELVKALKMYTIAYRIRRDNLTRNHPSLVVLLNMLGSIQIKRGELKEAMQIYELALQDSPVIYNTDQNDFNPTPPPITGNLLAKSVTYREMGTIYELWQNYEEALRSYHKSLDCITDWKNALRGDDGSTDSNDSQNQQAKSSAMENVKFQRTKSTVDGAETGEMELFLGPEDKVKYGMSKTTGCSKNGNPYESFFPPDLDSEIERSAGGGGTSSTSADSSSPSSKRKSKQRDSFADMDLALTLHQIAQLHRFRGDFEKSLDAYTVALRGMKYALGRHHPNVAAILGNIGNLQKERGDLDAAFLTYQEVLGIESYRLGLSHPDVAITLHNIATIDAARGNHEHSLQLYRKVIGLQKKLFGEDHHSVAVTAACMGEVYEKLGEVSNAMESFEEAMRIKSGVLGRHSLDVGRLLHKLGKLAFRRGDYMSADSFVSRAVLIYRLNKIDDSHEWVVDANRDAADIDGAIALGNRASNVPIAGDHFGEC